MNNILLKIKENYLLFLGLILSLFIAVGAFCYYGNEKEIIFCDEVYTYTIVNHGIGLNVRDNRWYEDGEMDYRLNSSSGYYGYKEAIEITGQDVHPPVYYLVFKTFSMLFPNSTSKWIGFAANLVAYIPMLALLYWAIWKISKKVWVATLLTILFGTHPGVLGYALLIRMYFWLAFWLFLFFLQTKKMYSAKETNWKMYIVLGAITFLGFMTQYYFAVYVVFFSLLWGIDRLIHGKWKQIFAYFATMISAVGLSTWFFPQWIHHIFFGYKGEDSFATLNSWDNYLEELKQTFHIVATYVFENGRIYWIAFFVIIGLFFTLRDSQLKTIKKHYMMHIAAQILYYCIVAHVMPSVEQRYFVSVILVQLITLLLMLTHVFVHYKLSERKLVAVGLAGVALVAVMYLPDYTDDFPYSGYKYKEGRLTVEEYADIPWVYYGERDWEMHCTAFDVLIPNQLMYIRDLSTLTYDEVLQSSSEIVVYTKTEDEINAFVQKMNEVSGLEWQCNYLAERAFNDAYLITCE